MQIRTIFHNADFLKKGTPEADARAALKACRRLVCVLLLLAVATSAWGAPTYWRKTSGSDWWNGWESSSTGTGGWSSGGSPQDGAIILLFEDQTLPDINFVQSLIKNLTIKSGDGNRYTLTVNEISLDGAEGDILNLSIEGLDVNCTTITINPWERVSPEISVSSGDTFKVGTMTIGPSTGYNDTTTTLSGDGTFIVQNAINFPTYGSGNPQDTRLVLDGNVTLKSDGSATITAEGYNTLTIEGTGTLDMSGVTVNTTQHPVSYGGNLDIPNPPVSNYTYTLGTVSLSGFPTSAVNIEITASVSSGGIAAANRTFSYSLVKTGTEGSASFTFNGNTSGSVELSEGSGNEYRGSFSLSCSNPSVIASGEGFKLIIRRPDGIPLTPIEWHFEGISWTGTNGTDWHTASNWMGVSDPATLSDKDITIELTANNPVISTGDTTVKTLTITDGASVTQSGSTILTTGSLTCVDSGVFSGTGGTVVFNGSAGTWTNGTGSSVFNNVTVASGATLTLNSPLHLTGNLDVSAGTLTQGDNAVIFEGSGTQASPETLKSAASLGELTFAGNGSSGYIKLLSNVTCSSLTVAEGVTLDCNGYMLIVSGTLTNNGTILCSEGTSAGMLMCDEYVPSDYGTDVVSVSGAVTLVISDDGEISKIKVTSSATITGSAACGFFEATGLGGKTLTITGQLKIGSGVTGTDATETLKLSGTSSSSKLKIAGAGSIKLNATQIGGQYLNVTGSVAIKDLNSDTAPIAFTTTDSTGPASPATVPAGWNICSGDLVYIWTGAAGSTTWSIPDNWSVGLVPESSATVEIPAGLTRYPVTPSTATTVSKLSVAANAELTLGSALTVSNVLTNTGTIDMKDFALSCGSYVDNSAAAETGGLIKLGTGTFNPGTGGTLKNIEFTANRSFEDISLLIIKNGTVDAGKTLTVTAGGLSFTGNFTSGGNLVMNADVSVDGTLTNSGTITDAGHNLTCSTYVSSGSSDSLQLSGTVVLTITNGTISEIKVTDSASVSGSFNCGKFIATGLGGKNLMLSATMTVGIGVSEADAAHALQLSGTSTSSRLTISGSDTISLNASQMDGKWLSVTSGPAISVSGGGVFVATYSEGTAPSGWILCDENLVYTWTGAADTTDWGTPSNWDVYLVPNSTDADVKIPAGLSKYPVSPSSQLSINSLTVAAGASVSVADDNKLRFVSYSGDGVIKLGTGNIEVRSAGTNCTIKNIEFTGTGTRSFADINKVTLVNLKVPSGKTLQLSGNLTLSGTLSNAGTVNTSGYKLTFGSYTDTSVLGTAVIQVSAANALALYSGGTGGEIKNLEFIGSGEFAYTDIDSLTYGNVTVGSNVKLTLNAIAARSNLFTIGGNLTNNGNAKLGGNLTVTGTVSNNKSLNCDNKILTASAYTHSVTNDAVLVNGGSIILTGNDSYTISNATLNASAKVTYNGDGNLLLKNCTVSGNSNSLTATNNGNGTLTLESTTFSADGKITQRAADGKSLPVFTKVTVGSAKTLTLNSALTAGILTNNGNVSSSGFNLSTGTLNNNGSITLNAAASGNSISCMTYNASSGSGDRLTLSGDVTLSIGTNQVSTIAYGGGNLTASGTVNAGSLTVSGSAATLTGTMNVAGNLTASSSLTVAGSTSVGGNLTVNSGLTVTGTASVAGNLSAAADVAVSGNTNVTGAFTATDCSVTVASGKTLSAGTYTQTAAGSGKSLTVNGTLTVGRGKTARNTFRISGVSGSPLTVDGSGSIQLNQSQVGGDYLSLLSSNLEVTQIPSGAGVTPGTDIVLTAIHSTGPVAPATVPAGWNLCADELTFIWKGGWSSNPTAWNEEHNWSVHIVPDVNASSSNSQANIGTVVVEIPATGTPDPVTSGTVKVNKLTIASTAANPRTLTLDGAFTVTSDLTNEGSITVQGGALTVQNNLTNSGSITQNSDVTVTNVLTNTGTIDMKNRNLTSGSYVDNSAAAETGGLIKLGTGTFNPGTGGTLKNIEFTASRDGQGTHPAGFENISGLTIKNGTVDTGKTLTVTAGGLSFTGNLTSGGNLVMNGDVSVDGTLTSSGTITQNGNLSVNGALTNNGTIDMQDKNLTCGSYADDGNNRWIKLGTGTFNPGTGGTLNNIEFTATRNFEDIAGLTITNGILDEGKTLTITSGGLSFAGNFTNKGTITQNGDLTVGETFFNMGTVSITGKALSFKAYNCNSAADSLSVNGGSITSTDGGGTITSASLKGNVTIKKTGTGAFTLSTVSVPEDGTHLTVTNNNSTGVLTLGSTTVSADTTLTADGTGSMPAFTTVSVASGKTLTLNSALNAGTLTNNGTVTASSGTLAVTGTLTNNGSVVAAGFNLSAETVKNNSTITLTSGSGGNSITGTYTKDTGVTQDKLSLTGNVTLTIGTNPVSSIAYAGGGTLTASGTLNTGVLSVTGSSATLAGTMNVAGDLTAAPALTIAGSVSVGGNLTASSSVTVSGTAGVGGDLTADGGFTVTGTGAASVTGNLTAAAGVTVSGTADIDGDLTAASDVTVSGSTDVTGTLKVTDGSVTVASGKTLSAGTYTQTAAGSGKSLTVNGTLTVGRGKTARNTFRISGVSGSPLTVDGNGSIQLNLSQVGGDYLSILSSNLEVTQIPSGAGVTPGTDIVLTAIHSTGPIAPATVHAGWNLCADELTFIWKGGWSSNPTAWNEEHNWSVHIVPNADSSSNAEANVISVNVEIPSAANSPKTSGAVTVKKLTMVSGMSLNLNGAFTVTTDLINAGSITIQGGALTVQNNLTNSGRITQNSDVTVTNVLTNTGTIDMKNRNLTCGSYADNSAAAETGGLIKLGTGTFNPGTGGTLKNIEFTASRDGQGTHPTGFENISGLTIKNGTVDAGVALTITSGSLTLTGTLTSSGTITQNGNLSVTGALTNNGTIDMKDRNLTCGSYADDGNNRWIKLGTGTFNPGTGGTLNNIEFTATRNFEDIAGLTITNGILDEGKTLTITADVAEGLSFAGNFTNKGTITQNGDLIIGGRLDNSESIDIGAQTLQFGWYNHTDTLEDELIIAGGSVTSTGNGTGMLKINKFTMNGNAAVTNNGTGPLRFETAAVNADALLTAGGTGSAPVFSNLNITGSNTLTLASDVTAGNITIGSEATLDADNRGKNADPNFAGYILKVSGNFINNNTTPSDSENVQYRGFIPRSGKVEITGSGNTRHEIKGNNKFNDFTCHEAGATLVFDVGTTTNVDHKIDLTGAAGRLIAMTTDSTVEGEKWTLDVIWDVAAGTPEHPKPVIKYVAPHKSISYSAILKGCLDNCVDDVNELLDSTNVNWFNDTPTILMTLAPVGGRQLLVLFSTEVTAARNTDLRTSIALKSGSVSNIIDPTVPVTVYGGTSDKAKTAVVFGLTRDLTWNDLYGTNPLHVEVVQTSAVRVGTTRISYQQGVSHCTSDFAVNAARMLYGYDNFIDSSTPLTIETGANSVRTWDQSDPISNRLHSDSDLLFQAQFDTSVPEGVKLEMVATLASQLNEATIGDSYENYYELSTRLWLPDRFQPLCTAGQTLPASQYIAQDSTSSGRLRNFSLHYNAASADQLFRMMDGEEIQFMFKVKNPDGTDLLIDHDYDEDNGVYTPTPKRPVYAIRLVDDDDIMSFDLWSVVLQSTTLQRGNVTILNNVINSDEKEQTFVTIQQQKAGNLTVQVLTLDGAVVTTLQRGRKQAGTWGYSWDGTNGKGKPVARGMYFIRVIGPDIDETRKVMVVRN